MLLEMASDNDTIDEKNHWSPLKFLFVLETWPGLSATQNPDNQDSHLFLFHM